MLGRSHVVAGFIAGELLSVAVGARSPEALAILGGVGAVGGYVPDLDCGSSTITRALGPVGWVLSHALRGFSRVLYAVTKGPRDEHCQGEHRHASHTLIFAALAGLLVVAGCSPWAGGLPLSPWLIGAAMTTGCVSHCLTDSMTVAGCPWLFPLPIAGEVWYEIRLLGPWSFHTGSSVETRFWRPLFIVAAVVLLPGVLPLLADAVAQAHHAPRQAAPRWGRLRC